MSVRRVAVKKGIAAKLSSSSLLLLLLSLVLVVVTLMGSSSVDALQDDVQGDGDVKLLNNPYNCQPLHKDNPELQAIPYPDECFQVVLQNAPSSLFDEGIYVAADGPTFYKQQTIEEVLATVGLLDDHCRIPLTSLMCGAQYPLCVNQSGVFELAPVCYSLCEFVLETCSLDVSIIQELECGNLTLSTNEATCLPFNSSDTIIPASCPSPFLIADNKDPVCSYPCRKNPFVSEPSATAANELKMWLSLLSFISDIIIILSVLTSKERRMYPSNLVAFIAFAQMLIAIPFIIGYGIGYENVWCRDATTKSTQTDKAFCGFEGTMLFLGAATLACYWLVISINLLAAVVFDVNFAQIEWKPYAIAATHLFAWGVPLTGMIVLLCLGEFVYVAPYWWCWIGDGLDLYFFWIWVGAFLILTGLFVLISIWKMYLIRKEVGRSVLARNLRLIYFISLYFLLFGFNFGLFVKGRVLEDEERHFTETYTTCLAYGEKNCHFNSHFNTAELIIQVILLSISGFLILLAFETRPGAITHWKRVFRSLLKGDWKGLKQLGSAPSV
eukprot:TRINITY_DN791_c0_g1_i1.p1 TRINITY_DN791_c0_g1~~TRINITY_DN791_c0_g1_i1.p1  ORF type:complete len:591 (-),score=88.53 TRINITY_DN791_c0_g1_i1:95-1759(-)